MHSNHLYMTCIHIYISPAASSGPSWCAGCWPRWQARTMPTGRERTSWAESLTSVFRRSSLPPTMRSSLPPTMPKSDYLASSRYTTQTWKASAKEQGNLLAHLYPTHTMHWWPIVEDVFMSSAIWSLRSSLAQAYKRNTEYLCVLQHMYTEIYIYIHIVQCVSKLVFNPSNYRTIVISYNYHKPYLLWLFGPSHRHLFGGPTGWSFPRWCRRVSMRWWSFWTSPIDACLSGWWLGTCFYFYFIF